MQNGRLPFVEFGRRVLQHDHDRVPAVDAPTIPDDTLLIKPPTDSANLSETLLSLLLPSPSDGSQITFAGHFVARRVPCSLSSLRETDLKLASHDVQWTFLHTY